MSPRAFAVSLVLTVASAAADFPALPNTEPGNPTPTTPQAALGSLKVPPGFRATLFAHEPDVQNPIAMAWDARGRMWVAENYTYAERSVRFDLALRDRVIILEDKDGDGCAESRKVFTDAVQMLTSVETGRGGVWLMCPPQLLFVPDANGDDVPDGPPQAVLDGFTVAQANYHNFANGLRWGPDGWLYGRCGASCPGEVGAPGTPAAERIPMRGGMWRYHPERKVFEALTHGTTNPWGHDWDEHGELFFTNTVNGHLWHAVPGAHFVRPHTLDPNPHVYSLIDTHADHWHFDTGKGWQASRDGAANALGGGHAHCGAMIYQGDAWPAEFRGKLFTLNFHGRCANVEKLERRGSGYVATHEPNAFTWGDPWFRAIDIRQGPDGAAYVLDWSDTGECHDHTGVHRTSGRIFRIQHEAAKTRVFAKSESAPGDRVPPSTDHLRGADEFTRVGAIRQFTDEWPLDTVNSTRPARPEPTVEAMLLAEFVRMASEDTSGLVRLTLASTLQRLPVKHRAELAAALVARAEDAGDHNLPEMVWYGLIPVAGQERTGLLRVAEAAKWPKISRWIARRLALDLETAPAALEQLLTLAARQPDDQRLATLRGVSDAFRGWRKAAKPAAWDGFAGSLAKIAGEPEQALLRDLGTLFGDGRALDEVRQLAFDKNAEMGVRQAALRTLIEARPPDLREVCEKLVTTGHLGSVALRGLAQFDDPPLGAKLARDYKSAGPDRATLIETLVTRPAWARELLEQVAAGKIPRTEISAFHARQIRGFNDAGLTARLSEVWGELRESASDKREAMAKLKAELTPAVLAKVDVSKGRAAFNMICAACHTLYGEGGKLGPDLTGSGRDNLDYLLENILDPSATVTADFRMTTLTLKDGRTLSGMVAGRTDRTLTLKTLTEAHAIERAEIARTEESPQSLMPDGLLAAFTPEQVRDLFAYLMSRQQAPLPK